MKPLKSTNFTKFIETKIFKEILNYRNSQMYQKYMGVSISFSQNLILIILFALIIVFFLKGDEIHIADSIFFLFIAFRLSYQMMTFNKI